MRVPARVGRVIPLLGDIVGPFQLPGAAPYKTSRGGPSFTPHRGTTIMGFKETWGMGQNGKTFTGGSCSPYDIVVVGLEADDPRCKVDPRLLGDTPAEPWNIGVWDLDRFPETIATPLDVLAMMATLDGSGDVDPVQVVKIQGRVLALDGRGRILCYRTIWDILRKRGVEDEDLPEIRFIPGKAKDPAAQMLTVRAANLGRRDDAAWVKAAQAARLMTEQTAEDGTKIPARTAAQVAALYSVSETTLVSWGQFMSCLPEIQAKVKAGEIPWNGGLAIGRCPAAKQPLIVAYMAATGAKTTGEIGRKNWEDVSRGVRDGKITQTDINALTNPDRAIIIPPAEGSKALIPDTGVHLTAGSMNGAKPAQAPGTPDYGPRPEHTPECAGSKGCVGTRGRGISTPGKKDTHSGPCPWAQWRIKTGQNEITASGHVGAIIKQGVPSPATEKARAKINKSPAVVVQIDGRMASALTMRQALGNLEPTDQEPLQSEDDKTALDLFVSGAGVGAEAGNSALQSVANRAVYAWQMVLCGQDPDGAGLDEWPYLKKAAKPFLRSPLVAGAGGK